MKHAYLIQAHTDFYILKKLICLIDDDRNDIYIHIDKKVKNFNFEYYKLLAKKSNIIFTKRIDVRWGNYSQIKSEYILFKEAYKKHYDYYHLISGVDMIIKTQDEIHNFFRKHNGLEFITFDYHNKVLETSNDRIDYYHLFTSYLKSKNQLLFKLGNSLHTRIFALQKSYGIKRKRNFEIRKGANWVSITDDLVGYILQSERFVKKYFKFSYCADELFIQTLVYNSKFYEKVYSKKDDDYNGSKRLIDWNRGEPYTFKKEDFEEIINSNRLFARKFNTNIDKCIVDKLYNYVRDDIND